MTNRQIKLVENYIRMNVRKSLIENEDADLKLINYFRKIIRESEFAISALNGGKQYGAAITRAREASGQIRLYTEKIKEIIP